MELFIKLLTVLGLGAIELWVAIPTGLALKLHPLATGVTAAAGAVMGVLFIGVSGERLRSWLLRKRSKKGKDGRSGLLFRIWGRYGVIGLGLLAPLITGAPLGAALGISLGVTVRNLLLWFGIGIILWSVILTVAGLLGMAGIAKLGP